MLANLGDIAEKVSRELKENNDEGDVKLATSFKDAFRRVIDKQSGDSIEYSTYTAVVTRKKGGNLKVYVSNQQFYIACRIVPFAKELQQYKDITIKVACKVTEKPDHNFFKRLQEGKNNLEIENFRSQAKEYFLNVVKEQETEAEGDTKLLVRFVTDYDWWGGNKTIERADFLISPAMTVAGLVQNSQSYVAEIAKYIAKDGGLEKAARDMLSIKDISGEIMGTSVYETEDVNGEISQDAERCKGGFNQIVYGAPGTGKSYYIDTTFGSDSRYIRRVTFHSEYTYYDFVGTYKPVPIYKKTDDEYETIDGRKLTLGEPHIDYRYVPGPFLDTYMEAWKDPAHMYTLIIEEINRANAAGVFGEIFQLLDRDIDGYSKYKVAPSVDLRNYMRSDPEMRPYADELRLPSNMNILATMNSADQGVEPMDAAFKRRWNFKYLPIQICNDPDKMSTLQYARLKVYWERLIEMINKRITDTLTNVDEDRLIGPYFISPREVGKKESVDKLLLYLWDDVFRNDRERFFNQKIHNFSDLSSKFETEDVLNVLLTDEERNYLEVNPKNNGDEEEDDGEQQ